MPTQTEIKPQSGLHPASASLAARHSLTESASFLLDIIRFSAALCVVVEHLGSIELNTGFRERGYLGDVAVPVFFVLSGFVIRFVTRSREHTLRNFFIDRASRMYSVIVPAMSLTVALALAVHRLNPTFYQQRFGAFSDHPLTRILLNLTFLSQSWGHSTVPFLNIPFWSLSYECLYYIAYGLYFYLRGLRRMVALILWAVFAGPQVLFLLPVWALGVVLYEAYNALRLRRLATILRNIALVFLVLAVIPLAPLHRVVVTVPSEAYRSLVTLRNPLFLLHISPYRATMTALVTGALATAVMFLLLLFSDLVRLAHRNVWVRRFRHLADGTFSIYLMHYPLMVLAATLGLYRHGYPAAIVAVTAAICLLLILAARPLDLLKVSMRTHMRRVLPGTS